MVEDACNMLSILYFHCCARAEVCTSREFPLHVEDRPPDLRLLGKRIGVLLPQVTASFLVKDMFGHNNGNPIV
jgi:hypothetical protein